jgi:esterase/lipase
MQGFANYFYSKGLNVISLRLPGHLTRNSEDINTVTANDWIVAAERAFQQVEQLGEQVEILGYSTGGTLGTYLALKYPQKVKALYLIAPALALNDRVLMASMVLGWTHMDLNKVCTPADSQNLACKMVLHTDAQLMQLYREGLNPAPAAGLQVQKLINRVADEFSHYGPSTDYYRRLRLTYQQLKVPLVMVNSGSDNVTAPDFNNSLMKTYSGHSKTLYFAKSLKISHLMISKSAEDAYHNSPETLNPRFQQILETIESLNSNH